MTALKWEFEDLMEQEIDALREIVKELGLGSELEELDQQAEHEQKIVYARRIMRQQGDEGAGDRDVVRTKTSSKKGKKKGVKKAKIKKKGVKKAKFEAMKDPDTNQYTDIPLSNLHVTSKQGDLSWGNTHFKKQNVDEFKETVKNGDFDANGKYVFIVVPWRKADRELGLKEDQIRYINTNIRGRYGSYSSYGHTSLLTESERRSAKTGYKRESTDAFKVRFAGEIVTDKDGKIKKYRNKSGHWHPPGAWMMVFARHWGLPEDKKMWDRLSAKEQYIAMLDDPIFFEERDDVRAALASFSSYGDEIQIYDEYYGLYDSSIDSGYYDDDYDYIHGQKQNAHILHKPASAVIYQPNHSTGATIDYEVIVTILAVSVLLLCMIYWIACLCCSAFTVINWRKQKQKRSDEYASEQEELCV